MSVLKARSRLANEVKRARRAGDQDSSAVNDARRELAEAKLAAYIEQVLADCPPLSPEVRSKLAVLLKGCP